MRHTEVLTGRIGQVRDLNELANGNCVVSFSVAETPRVKNKSGQWEDGVTIWTDVSIFGDEARNLVRSVKPGTFVTVIGNRQAREYTPKDSSEKRVVQQLVAEQVAVSITKFNYVESIGNVNYAKEGTGGATQAKTTQKTASKPAKTASADPFSDDPFSDGGDAFGTDDDPFSLG